MALNADDYPSPADILAAAAETFRDRNTEYKANYLIVGEVMAILFPHGVTALTPHQHAVLHFVYLIVIKLTRLTNSSMTHADSMRDLSVYAAMLESITSPKAT